MQESEKGVLRRSRYAVACQRLEYAEAVVDGLGWKTKAEWNLAEFQISDLKTKREVLRRQKAESELNRVHIDNVNLEKQLADAQAAMNESNESVKRTALRSIRDADRKAVLLQKQLLESEEFLVKLAENHFAELEKIKRDEDSEFDLRRPSAIKRSKRTQPEAC
mmetsp:Transcript_9790/g.17644  ORF Transcript_9790/g.17644 Transcript_9790/m.17644 type:complete len:164 (-) Transcript_9790:84-575(-)